MYKRQHTYQCCSRRSRLDDLRGLARAVLSVCARTPKRRKNLREPVGRKEEKRLERLDCWPLSKLATTLNLSLWPYTPWFCANLLSAPLFTWGPSQKVIDTTISGAPCYADSVPPTDTAANSTVTINPGLLRLRLNKPPLYCFSFELPCIILFPTGGKREIKTGGAQHLSRS